MPLRLSAEFWRLWTIAAALSLVVLLIFMSLPAVHAEGSHHGPHRHGVGRRTVHHHRHHVMRSGSSNIALGRGSVGDAVAIALHYLGSGNPTGSRGPWCGDFMNLLEHLAGRPGIASRMATAWAGYGRPSGPVPGAIAVFRGHVARVMARLGDRLEIISGNWSHRVGIGWVSLRSAIAFRMP